MIAPIVSIASIVYIVSIASIVSIAVSVVSTASIVSIVSIVRNDDLNAKIREKKEEIKAYNNDPKRKDEILGGLQKK